MPKKQWLKMDDLEKKIRKKRKWIYQKISENSFPAPIKIGWSSMWDEQVIEDWMSQKEKESNEAKRSLLSAIAEEKST